MIFDINFILLYIIIRTNIKNIIIIFCYESGVEKFQCYEKNSTFVTFFFYYESAVFFCVTKVGFPYQSIGFNELSRMIKKIFSVKSSIKSYATYGDNNM